VATFVIVHGATSGGWIFAPTARFLRARGHEVFTPTLTGQGERAHLADPSVGLATHVDDVVNVLEYEDLHDVVLAGASYAGMVVTGVADRIPERIAHLVYVDAVLPRDGEAFVDLIPADWRQRILAAERIGDWRLPLRDDPEPRLVRQQLRTFVEPLRLTGGAHPSRTYIRCTSPLHPGLAPSHERALAEPGFVHRELPCGHSASREMPERLADLLDDAARTATAK
jgi:pimeloyl-ACP methyl ester carboxylesterase